MGYIIHRFDGTADSAKIQKLINSRQATNITFTFDGQNPLRDVYFPYSRQKDHWAVKISGRWKSLNILGDRIDLTDLITSMKGITVKEVACWRIGGDDVL